MHDRLREAHASSQMVTLLLEHGHKVSGRIVTMNNSQLVVDGIEGRWQLYESCIIAIGWPR